MKVTKRLAGLVAMLTLVTLAPAYADVTEKDIQVLGRAIGFIENGQTWTVSVPVAYPDRDAASQATADPHAELIGTGRSAGKLTMNAASTAMGALSSADIILVPNGQSSLYDAVKAATSSGKGISASADKACAAAGACVISVASDPKVEIFMSSSASAAANVSFGSAFRMMIKEL